MSIEACLKRLSALVFMASLLAIVTSCSSDCDPGPCAEEVAIRYQGTGPDSALMSIDLPFTITLEIHDSDGQVSRETLVYDEPTDDHRVALDRHIVTSPFSLSVGRPLHRDALPTKIYVEVDGANWYGAQTFEMDYFENSSCCTVSVHDMDFQPKRDLP